MSHQTAEKNEPNLTPLLDVVLQLVMFFMISANFIMEQVDQNIKLPFASAARPMEKAGVMDPLFLNIDRDGNIDIYKKVFKTADIQARLQQVVDDTKRTLEVLKRRPEEFVDKQVVIRADKNADFGKIYPILKAARAVGFEKIQLRAFTNG